MNTLSDDNFPQSESDLNDPQWLDVLSLSSSLAEAVSTDLSPVTSAAIFSAIITRLRRSGSVGSVKSTKGKTLVDSLQVYYHFPGWLADIGHLSGIKFEGDTIDATWIPENMPKTKLVVKEALDLLNIHLKEAEQRYRVVYGFKPSEAMSDADSYGESFDQTLARYKYATRGLRLVEG